MPTYEYECQTCRKRFDVQETVGDHARQQAHPCPACGSVQVRQVITDVPTRTNRKT